MKPSRAWVSLSPLWFLLLFLVASAGRAQSITNQLTANNATGTMPYVSYGGVHENINLATGNMNIQVPLLSLPGRNKLDLNLGITYDSKRWVLTYTYDPFAGTYTYFWVNQPIPPSLGVGWRFNVPVLQTTNRDFGARSGFTDTGCWTDFVVTMPDGSKHIFRNKAGCWGYNPSVGTVSFSSFNRALWDSQDGSVMRLDTTNPADVVLYLKNGTRMHFFSNLGISSGYDTKVADRIEDTDGNQITIDSPGGTGGFATINSITDTMNRVITFTYSFGSPASVSYKDGTGTTRSINFAYGSPTCNPTFSLPAGSFHNGGCESLASVTLPNNLQYSFQYNSTQGELSKITYPTGGYTRYDYATYTNLQQYQPPDDSAATTSADFREVSARYVCRNASGSCAAEDTTTYTPTITSGIPNNSYMNVLDASGNLTRFQFTQAYVGYSSSPRELMHWRYNGPTTGSPLLRTVQTDYNQLDSGGNPKDDSLPIRVTTTLNDSNQVTKVEYDYDSYNAAAFGGPATEYIDNVIEQREYAYGMGAVGALVRKTDYTWLKINPLNATDYTATGIHIFDRKATEKAYDSASTLFAQSQFEYDKYDASANHAALVASGAVQRDSAFSTSYTKRGHVTAAQRWRNSDGVWLLICPLAPRTESYDIS